MKILDLTVSGRHTESGSVLPEGDAVYWESLKAGSVSAFEAIFRAHYDFLYNYGLRFHDDEDEIKDCLQVLFLTIWERRQNLGTTNSIRNYLLASLRRLILKRLKSQDGRQEIDPDSFHLQVELPLESTLIMDQSTAEDLALLRRSMEKLPERQKEAIYLKYYGDQSFAEIAGVMNITTRAVYKLIYKALDSLNATLSQARNK
ncbi:RNA polymerase sigma factor [Salmonirosea aquatica]|uniref:Sigma-70 family RNA polymerase sigma factor n=1 Tax=Salmonirosea aquatica TaxID=2654236 RepID=A0A7C9FBR1_9BACT|nr:sigma-70 family RNA polymerase sigma factor [Cytophagaceae bacterium SJW1-29]